jgi:hypothetical protein
MKTIILILTFIWVTNLSVFSKGEKKLQSDKWESVKNIDDIRMCRFTVIPTYSYKDDSDINIIGDIILIYNKDDESKENIQDKINNKQNSKFKSTYLDFTILQEENIS